jgi:hypothetical protein
MSFHHHARRVHDTSQPRSARVGALRSCVRCFAFLTRRSYVASMSWLRAQQVGDWNADEAALLRAVCTVAIERNRFLHRLQAFERRRIRQKARGSRQPRGPDVAALYANDPRDTGPTVAIGS